MPLNFLKKYIQYKVVFVVGVYQRGLDCKMVLLALLSRAMTLCANYIMCKVIHILHTLYLI
jgi:hypothetical protein